MSFSFFLLVVAVLFIRPAELIPELENVPIYEWAILMSLACTAGSVIRQLTPRALALRPITVCVIALLGAIVLSQMSHLRLSDSYQSGFTFFKVVVLYLLVVGNVRTLPRLRFFLAWLGILILGMTLLALLQYHEVVSIPALAVSQHAEIDTVSGDILLIPRLCGPGIFNDPNYLCVIMAIAIIIAFYWLGDRHLGPARLLCLVPLGVFGYAVAITHSRGGFIALLAGLLVLLRERIGSRRTILAAVFLVPLLFFLFAGRQTELDLGDKEGSSQTRVRLWRDGLMAIRSAPVFGMGQGTYAEISGQAAHNSFLEAYTEMGFIGGTFFLGSFVYAFWGMRRLGCQPQAQAVPPAIHRLRPFMVAIVAVQVVGMLSLSRVGLPPTYVVLGLATAFCQIGAASSPVLMPRLRPAQFIWISLIGMVFLMLTHVFVLVAVQRA